MKRFNMIIIDGRKWFDKVNGNTYHGVTVTIKHKTGDDIILNSGMVYGYGEQYIQTAIELIQKAGYCLGLPEAYKGQSEYCKIQDFMRNNRNKFYITCKDNCKKRDL